MKNFYYFLKKVYRQIAILLLLLIGQIDAFIIEGTLIKTADRGLLAVEELTKGDFVCSCDKTGIICNAEILNITKFEINNCLEVIIESDFSFLTSTKQIFF